jgi:hemerythrin-like domain-containing protein
MEPKVVTSSDPGLKNFSDCHVGIVGALRELGELPTHLDSARRAREIAHRVRAHFRDVILTHHSEEESQLFPAVQSSATEGDERARVDQLVTRLTAEHRRVEAEFAMIDPVLSHAERGQDADLDPGRVRALVSEYLAHARFEEEVFLPLAQEILGRNGNHLAALGLSLHVRHSAEEMRRRFGHI